MEKSTNHQQQIVITGPESTGKTELAKGLASQFCWHWEPELSRRYVENLNRKYTYEDVVQIANYQMETFARVFTKNLPTFFDTGLIITKVWFEVVFEKCPGNLINFLKNQPKIWHLLCATDIPWIPDAVRENGGEMREQLFDRYKQELEIYNFPYHIIYGLGESRMQNATGIIQQLNIL